MASHEALRQIRDVSKFHCVPSAPVAGVYPTST